MANCTICTKMDPEIRKELDKDLVSGASVADVAAKYFQGKNQRSAENIVFRHKDHGHIMQEVIKSSLDVRRTNVLDITTIVGVIFERCCMLSKKAEEVATTARDFESSARCLDPAIKSLSLLSGQGNKDETGGISALEEYVKRQKKLVCNNGTGGSES